MYVFKSIYVRTASVFCSCSLVMALVKEIRCAQNCVRRMHSGAIIPSFQGVILHHSPSKEANSRV